MAIASRTVFVTGAGSGIGSAIAREFGLLGDTVFVNDVSESAARDQVRALAKEGIDARPVIADVRDQSAVAKMITDSVQATSRLDVLVNCAGILSTEVFHDVLTMPDGAWEEIIAVNLTGAFYCAREAARHMATHGGGCIVNISSVAGIVAEWRVAAYCASKAGLIGLTRALALELADRDIRVNAVAPGWIDTRKAQEWEEVVSPNYKYPKKTPLGKGTPRDVAGAVVYLASDAARFVTGTTLVVDGGSIAY